MSTASAQVDAYIAGLPVFGQDICNRLRQIIKAAIPEAAEEWKWGPHYAYKGMICGYSAFKKHAKLTFFNGVALDDEAGLFNHCTDNDFSRSVKFERVEEIDEAVLTTYLRKAVAANEAGFKRVISKDVPDTPDDLQQQLDAQPPAKDFFEKLTPGYKREYLEWILAAKQPKTRQSRIEKTVEKCAAGETRHQKYKN